MRSCLIGMALAGKIGLPLQDRRDLYYAILLKDVGCSSNAARVHELLELHETRPLDDQLSDLVQERVLVREEAEG